MADAFNPVGWFEVPVTDLDRAKAFYSAVLGYEFEDHDMDGVQMAWFPMHENAMGAMGSLVKAPIGYKPSTDGALIYYSCPSGDVSNEEAKVEAAGGKVLAPKKDIGEYGFFAVCQDTEGNRFCLHSM